MVRYKKFLPLFLSVLLLALLLLPGQASLEGFDAINRQERGLPIRYKLEPQEPFSTDWSEHAEDGMVEVLIRLNERADTGRIAREIKMTTNSTKADVAAAVVESLQEVAEKSQAPLLEFLKDKKPEGNVDEIKSFFIVNVVYARLSIDLIDEISKRPDVDSVLPNESIELIEPVESSSVSTQVNGGQWNNIERIKAPQVWEKNYDGEGVVVGVIDTGVDWTHEALKEKWRGYDPENPDTPNSLYNWLDVANDQPAPIDNNGHGTHVAGTVLGSGPEGNNHIGVAPGAKWIAVRAFTNNSTTQQYLLTAGEYMLAPYDPEDRENTADPGKRPHIIINSWGGGFRLNETYLDMVKEWRNAGILPVFAAGNSGPGYGTVAVPGNYPESFSVAATGSDDNLASFSSRGPAPYDHPESMQPNISAPGVDIYSAVPDNKYNLASGTSMAAPHIAGVAALLLSSDPDLTVEELENMIMNSASPITDDVYPDSPNYGYGYGLVNALEALSADKNAPDEPAEPALQPPIDDAAYAWVNTTYDPWISRGPVTIKVPEANIGILQPNDDLLVVAGDIVEDTWYIIGYDYNSGLDYLFEVDTVNGSYNKISALPNEHNGHRLYYSGLAYDTAEQRLYASATATDSFGYIGSYLCVIDSATGITDNYKTLTGNYDQLFFGLAFDSVNNLYGCEMTTDPNSHSYLYSIEKTTGTGTLIGSLGSDFWWEGQDLVFDRVENVLYGAFINFDTNWPGLYKINTSSGEANLLNNTYYIFSGLANAYDQHPVTSGVARLSGNDRYLTTAEIVKNGWSSADTVVLSRGDDYADAVAGVPLAYQLNAPILLTPTANLDGAAKAEIRRLGANNVILLGGSAAISDAVKDELESKGLTVDRIAGNNRYETAVAVAIRLAEIVDFDTAFIADGQNFPDALAASSYAARRGEPILLTKTDSLPGATSAAIKDLGINKTYICGGTDAVSNAVEQQLPNPTRISGANRYATGLALAKEFLPNGANHIGIATGLNFPDAMAGGAWAAKFNTGIILVDGDKISPGSDIEAFLADQNIKGVTFFGGPSAISNGMETWFKNNLK